MANRLPCRMLLFVDLFRPSITAIALFADPQQPGEVGRHGGLNVVDIFVLRDFQVYFPYRRGAVPGLLFTATIAKIPELEYLF